jgi:hypothetical protein
VHICKGLPGVGRLLEEDDLSFTFFAIYEDKGSIEEYSSKVTIRRDISVTWELGLRGG